jgi:hypothetical protein
MQSTQWTLLECRCRILILRTNLCHQVKQSSFDALQDNELRLLAEARPTLETELRELRARRRPVWMCVCLRVHCGD